jgi:hypothetical protein
MDRVMVAVRKRPARETEHDIVCTSGDRIMEVSLCLTLLSSLLLSSLELSDAKVHEP